MPHTCHAIGCEIPVPPRLLCCKQHWYAVPPALRKAVWAAYQSGQEQTKRPSRAYLRAAAQAIIAVAEREGQPIPPVWHRLAAEEVREETML